MLGTATAASLWATGAIGVSVGLSALYVTVAAFTFLTMRLLPLDRMRTVKVAKKDLA